MKRLDDSLRIDRHLMGSAIAEVEKLLWMPEDERAPVARMAGIG